MSTIVSYIFLLLFSSDRGASVRGCVSEVTALKKRGWKKASWGDWGGSWYIGISFRSLNLIDNVNAAGHRHFGQREVGWKRSGSGGDRKVILLLDIIPKKDLIILCSACRCTGVVFVTVSVNINFGIIYVFHKYVFCGRVSCFVFNTFICFCRVDILFSKGCGSVLRWYPMYVWDRVSNDTRDWGVGSNRDVFLIRDNDSCGLFREIIFVLGIESSRSRSLYIDIVLCRVRCGSPVGGRNIAESSAKKIINMENNVYSNSGIIDV